MSLFTLAIVGRPNVGKSTLFNRFAGKKLAIVNDTPGVTRDWREAEGWLLDQQVRVIDTAGLEEAFDDSIWARMRKQTEAAIAHADAILFVIDGRAGLTPLDSHFGAWLREQNKPVVLAVNKCENEKAAMAGVAEAWALGLGDPVPISAAHGHGIEDLYHLFAPYFPPEIEEDDDEREDDFQLPANLDELEGNEEFDFMDAATDALDDPEKPIKLAIVGRPNVGKSTLMNALLREERVMTGPEAGITRDAIAVQWEWKGQKIRLVDTAGLRKRSKITDQIEKMSTHDSLRAIRLAQVVVLVVDANQPLEKQDLHIADHVLSEGRALILAVNKWDSVKDRSGALELVQYRLDTSLGQIKELPKVTISAINSRNLPRLMDTVISTFALWHSRVRTGPLNRWLRNMESQHPPPLVSGRPNRLRYITQIKTKPPTFALWCGYPDDLPDSYQRYLMNGLRETFDMQGIPVRLHVRTSKNPYSD